MILSDDDSRSTGATPRASATPGGPCRPGRGTAPRRA